MSVDEKQSTQHSYPKDLARFVYERWEEETKELTEAHVFQGERADALPPLQVLEWIISVCYQSSLLSEERRPVALRVILGDPSRFPTDGGPPTGLQPLVFEKPLAFAPEELRALSPAVVFHRSLVGIALDQSNTPYIWGIVQSGPNWMKSLRGGRGASGHLPPYLVVYVTGPGRIEVNCGLNTVGQLSDGAVFGRSMNIFDSKWYSEAFAPIRAEVMALHNAERAMRGHDWAELDPQLIRVVGLHMNKRIIASMRNSHHGGTLIFVPPDLASELEGKNPSINLKYRFHESPARSRFRLILLEIMEQVARHFGKEGKNPEGNAVGWREYAMSRHDGLALLGESIFEMGHLIASLSTIDGAVLVTKRWELLGFGGEILCGGSDITTVARARDLEGEHVVMESSVGVGTRHRSVYRFCGEHHDAIGIVASQDGDVRIVAWKGDCVTYWDHQAIRTSLEI
jgi:hypothetical protein